MKHDRNRIIIKVGGKAIKLCRPLTPLVFTCVYGVFFNDLKGLLRKGLVC